MTMENSVFDNELLETLLNMEEGSTLDFKQEQYVFEKATDRDKSELLKDILAFANTHRYRTAYILVGVKEVKGGKSIIVGVDGHLDDASLHQFVSFKTNRPAAFSYFPFEVKGATIGVLSLPIQRRPVYLLSKYGKLDANVVYVRNGSSTKPATPDEIADMGRTNLPRLAEWSIHRLRNLAKNAIITTAEQWQSNPAQIQEFDPDPMTPDYTEARDWVLEKLRKRNSTVAGYPKGMDSYDSLRWVLGHFEELGNFCSQTMRMIGPALIESGALMRAIVEMESTIDFEKRVWDEFLSRKNDEMAPLPGEANYNLLTVAARTVRFVDVLDDEEHYGDLEIAAFRPNLQPVFLRSNEWGSWRR